MAFIATQHPTSFNSGYPFCRPDSEVNTMKTYMCVVCGYVYEEAEGRPEDGIAPGTAWADVPADWMCPECNVGKAQFQMVEI